MILDQPRYRDVVVSQCMYMPSLNNHIIYRLAKRRKDSGVVDDISHRKALKDEGR